MDNGMFIRWKNLKYWNTLELEICIVFKVPFQQNKNPRQFLLELDPQLKGGGG